MAKRRKVNGFEDRLVDVVGDLDLGDLGLSNLDGRGGEMGSIGIAITTEGIRVSTEVGVASIGEGKGGGRGNGFGGLGLVSVTPLSGLTYKKKCKIVCHEKDKFRAVLICNIFLRTQLSYTKS